MNCLPCCPTRICRNRIGPFDVALIAIAISTQNGRQISQRIKPPTMSIARFRISSGCFVLACFERSG